MSDAAATTSQRAPGEGFLVLWTGAADAGEREIIAALREEGVRVEEVALDGLVDRANLRAPDLVALAGMAAQAPDAFVQQLGQTQPGAFVPVVTVGPSSAARPKARSRFGLVARLDRDEGAAPLAKRIATLLRGLSRRPPRWRVRAGIEDLPSLARRTAAAGRTGLLAAKEGGALAIDGEHIAPEPGLLVAALTGVIEPELALHERAPGTVRVLRELSRGEETAPSLDGVRVLVIDENLERGRALGARLEKANAQARSTGVVSQAVHAGRAIDPALVVISAPALVERAVASLWEDPRLSTASLLVLDGAALEARPADLLGAVAGMCRPEHALRRRVEKGEALAERLESVGPTRWLKLLGGCEHEVSLRVFAAAGRGRIDLSGGKIQGASFRPADPRAAPVEGRPAVEALMGLRFGRVLVGPPGELGKVEGMRRTRRPSIVGRIVPTPPSGVRRKQGLVAEEVVVQSTGISPAVKVPRVTVPAPSRGAREGDYAPIGGLDDDDEMPTRTYSAEAVADLRAQLERDDGGAAGGEGGTGGGATDTTSEGTEDSDESGLLHLDDEPAEPRRTLPAKRRPPRDEPPRSERPTPPAMARATEQAAQRADAERKADVDGGVTAREPVARTEGDRPDAPAPGAADRGAPPAADRAAPVDRDPIAAATDADTVASPGAERDRPPIADAQPVTAERSQGSGWWFAAGIVLALGVGGYAAWRLADEGVASPPPVASDDRPPRGGAVTGAEEGDPDRGETPTGASEEGAGEGTTGAVTPSEGATPGEATPSDGTSPTGPTPPPGAASSEATPAEATPDEGTPDEGTPDEGTPAEATPTEAAAGEIAEAAPSGTPVWDLVEQSSEAARAQDYERSEALARQALAASPRNAPAAYRLAVALFRQRRSDEAMEWAVRASEWDPEDPLPLSLQGDLHMRVGRFHDAARAYQRAIEAEPHFGPAQRRLDQLRERGVIQQ